MRANEVIFGVAGNPPNFWDSKYNHDRANAPLWLKEIGLDALEVQCGYGIRMPDSRANDLFEKSKLAGIKLSLHGPYYISIGSSKPEKIENSLNELTKSVSLAKKIGSDRVIFHPGSAYGNREEALRIAIETLHRFESENKIEGVYLYPEIAGKINQLGSLEEIMLICKEVKIAYPCLDLAHLHARTQGSMKTKDDFKKIMERLENQLGKKATKNLHIHLYPVEWGRGGEIMHKAFSDKKENQIQKSLFHNFYDNADFYLPRYEGIIDYLINENLDATIICEAKNSQDVGALEMKNYFRQSR